MQKSTALTVDLALLAHNSNQTLCPDTCKAVSQQTFGWAEHFFSKRKKNSVKAQLCWNPHIQGKVAAFLGVRGEGAHCSEKICGGVVYFVGGG